MIVQVRDQLSKRGVVAADIHGDRSQGQREKALSDFRGGALNVRTFPQPLPTTSSPSPLSTARFTSHFRANHLHRVECSCMQVLVATDVASRGIDVPEVGTTSSQSNLPAAELLKYELMRTAVLSSSTWSLADGCGLRLPSGEPRHPVRPADLTGGDGLLRAPHRSHWPCRPPR